MRDDLKFVYVRDGVQCLVQNGRYIMHRLLANSSVTNQVVS